MNDNKLSPSCLLWIRFQAMTSAVPPTECLARPCPQIMCVNGLPPVKQSGDCCPKCRICPEKLKPCDLDQQAVPCEGCCAVCAPVIVWSRNIHWAICFCYLTNKFYLKIRIIYFVVLTKIMSQHRCDLTIHVCILRCSVCFCSDGFCILIGQDVFLHVIVVSLD